MKFNKVNINCVKYYWSKNVQYKMVKNDFKVKLFANKRYALTNLLGGQLSQPNFPFCYSIPYKY